MQNGFAKKIVQYNGTIVLFQLINRILSDDKGSDADFTIFKPPVDLKSSVKQQ